MIGKSFELVLRNKDTNRETRWDLDELVGSDKLVTAIWLFSRKAPWLATKTAAFYIGMAVLEKLKRNRNVCKIVRHEMEKINAKRYEAVMKDIKKRRAA